MDDNIHNVVLPQLTHTCHILVTSNDSLSSVQTLFLTKCAKYFQMSKDDGYPLFCLDGCIKILPICSNKM